MHLLKSLLSRRWWWVTLIVVILMGVLARLGVWQLDRLEQRRAANAVVAASLATPPVDVGNFDLSTDISSLENRQVSAGGTFDHDRQVLLKVQNWGYRAGVNLITPLVLDDGEPAVLVDRGWIPDTEAGPEGRSAFDVPGEVDIEGYIALSQVRSRATVATPEGPLTEVYRVDISTIQPQMPYTLLPFYVVQNPQNNNEQLPYRLVRQLDLSEGSHLGYAAQWFIFSIGLGIAYLAFVNKSNHQTE